MIKRTALLAVLFFSTNSFTGIVDDLRAELLDYYDKKKSFIEQITQSSKNAPRPKISNSTAGRDDFEKAIMPSFLDSHRMGALMHIKNTTIPDIFRYLDRIRDLALTQEVSNIEIEDLLSQVENVEKLLSYLGEGNAEKLNTKKSGIRMLLSLRRKDPGFRDLAGTSSAVLRLNDGAKPIQPPAGWE